MGEWMKHTFIIGYPRSGKTTFAAALFRNLPKHHMAIFFNTQNESYFHGVNETFKKPDFDSFKPGRRLVYNGDDSTALFEFIEQAFESQRNRKLTHPLTIFVDEAHVYWSRKYDLDRPANVVSKNVFTRGLKYNIRVALITQKPQFCLPDLFRICERLVVFKVHPADEKYLQQMGIPVENPTIQYDYQVIE